MLERAAYLMKKKTVMYENNYTKPSTLKHIITTRKAFRCYLLLHGFIAIYISSKPSILFFITYLSTLTT